MDNDSLKAFDRFLKSSDINMLEAALPYVSERTRIPLALSIKALEIQRILQDFNKEEVLTACGFENRPSDPEAMLRAMKMAGGNNASPQIDQLLQMMNLLRTYQSIHEMMQKNPEMLSLLNNMMNQSQTPASPQEMLRQAMPKGADANQMMSLLSELLRSGDFPH